MSLLNLCTISFHLPNNINTYILPMREVGLRDTMEFFLYHENNDYIIRLVIVRSLKKAIYISSSKATLLHINKEKAEALRSKSSRIIVVSKLVFLNKV